MKCLNPNHSDRSALARGLCQNCYVSARNLIKQGKTTWAKLEAAGKARKPCDKANTGQTQIWLLNKIDFDES